MIRNDAGEVALQHRTTNPATAKTADGTRYHFIPKFNVCMCWVKEEHVDELMRMRARVCCGKKGQKFYYSTQINVNLWMTGNRHGIVNE